MQVQAPSLLVSKKFGASVLASVLSFFALRYGMPVEHVALVVGPLLLYVGAQGVADAGKERAFAEGAARAAAPLPSGPRTTFNVMPAAPLAPAPEPAPSTLDADAAILSALSRNRGAVAQLLGIKEPNP